VVGGAMPGAAALAAESAARGGAGYVRLSSPRPVTASHAIVQQRTPDFASARAVLVGPGWAATWAPWHLLEQALTAGVPAVVDADALWMLADMGLGGMAGPAIVTPHEGEFAHVYGDDAGQQGRADALRRRGHRQRDRPQGPRHRHRRPRRPRGDRPRRLALAVDRRHRRRARRASAPRASRSAATPFAAACEAVWLHGEAARLAGAGFVADDLVTQIPAALAACL
jgi:NAD(P)H-hydrate repair Nnr-like enzyme with NAD(P)H-hydrate dehydratase domain